MHFFSDKGLLKVPKAFSFPREYKMFMEFWQQNLQIPIVTTIVIFISVFNKETRYSRYSSIVRCWDEKCDEKQRTIPEEIAKFQRYCHIVPFWTLEEIFFFTYCSPNNTRVPIVHCTWWYDIWFKIYVITIMIRLLQFSTNLNLTIKGHIHPTNQ